MNVNPRLRPLTVEDLSAVLELHRRSEALDGVPRILALAELEEDLDGTSVRMETDAVVAELDGRLAGYGYTYHIPSEVKEERCYCFGQVDPEHRRQGVGTAILRWTLERARAQLLTSTNALPKYVRTEQFDGSVGSGRLFTRQGLEPVRWTDELLRPLTDLPPRPAIEGVEIVPWPVERSEEIREVKNTTFRDHWGSTPMSVDQWRTTTTGHGARLDLSFVALDDDGAVVGFSLNKRFEDDDELFGRRDGWIESLGTLREWRGRGVASALIAHSLDAFAAADLTHAGLAVDTENPSGAARLYRSLGFEPRSRWITFQESVTPQVVL